MTAAPTSPVPVLLLVLASLIFWPMVIVGAVQENDALAGAAVIFAVVVAVVVIVVAVRRSSARKAEQRRILDQGTLTTARVVSAKANGSLNNNPYVDFVLEVQPEGREPYRVDHRTVVSQMAIPRVQPGAEIDVYVDPGDRHTVVIDPDVVS